MARGTAKNVMRSATRLLAPARKAKVTRARAIDASSTGASVRRMSGVALRRRVKRTAAAVSSTSAPTPRNAKVNA
jgi:hypothetical protein